MVIQDDSDPLVSLEAGKEIAATIPESDIWIIRRSGTRSLNEIY